MMKRGSKIVCALLACALLGGAFAGCAETDPDPTPEVTDASVWSTYSTAKVTQNTKESAPVCGAECRPEHPDDER